jgi:ketosteroid isomerase-like protein
MIASWIMKRMIRSGYAEVNEDDMDVAAVLRYWADDVVWDGAAELGVGQTIKGKKAIADWWERWKKEFPHRNFMVKNICFSGWPLSPNNVSMTDWTLTQTDKEGRVFVYDGVSVSHMRNYQVVHVSDYISFVGLPMISDLLKPTGKAPAERM